MSGDKEKKGFAGLDSMVSDIEVPKAKEPPAQDQTAERISSLPWRTGENKEPPAPDRTAERPAEPTEQPTASQKPSPYTGNPPSGGGGLKWGWIIGILIVLLIVFSNSGNNQPPPQSVQSPTPAQKNVPNQSPTPPSTVTANASNRPTEVEPPVGDNLILNTEQIWYCLSEDIRLAGMRNSLNNGSQIEVNQFNAVIGNYNSRCGHFRYRAGALEAAREKVELYRALLLSEGAQRVYNWRQIATPVLATPPIQQEITPTFKEAQVPRGGAPKREIRPLASDSINQRQHEPPPVKSKAQAPSVQTSFPSYQNALGAVQALDKKGVAHFLDNGYGINQKINGNTLLVVAVRMGNYEMVEYIINRGADINQRDSSGDSPMMAAKKSTNPNVRLIKLLKDHGAINVCKKIILTNPTWTTDCGIETDQ